MMTPMRCAAGADAARMIAAKRCFPPNYLHESWARLPLLGHRARVDNQNGDRVRAVAPILP